ncbi:MAG TPA: rhodanese-like domain-containing protein [Micromonosporaceae bacterium]
MVTRVDLRELRGLIADGAQLVEVLPAGEYREGHLPGAVGIPLKELDQRAPRELDRGRPVVAYCWDWLCDLGPRAAHRLESLGFTNVYQYKAGKVDWLANGLPVEGEESAALTVGRLARDDVVTATPDETVGKVRDRVAVSPYRFALVVDEHGVVLGRLRQEVLSADPDARADRVMEAGPATLRPNIRAEELAEHMRHKDLRYAIVTTPEGRLLGVARRADLEAAVATPEQVSGSTR